MNQDKIIHIVVPLLAVAVFGGILIVGFLGISIQEEQSKRCIEQCLQSEQCIEQVKTLRNDSFNCYTDKECRKTIRGLK